MPHINSNLLALRRKRLGYEQKQIAVILGHKNTVKLSRYETGNRTPSLRDAIKLAMLYNLPVRVLFERYFRRSREELENSIKKSGVFRDFQQNSEIDYCSYLELLKSDRLTEIETNKVRRHIKVLVEERSKKIFAG